MPPPSHPLRRELPPVPPQHQHPASLTAGRGRGSGPHTTPPGSPPEGTLPGLQDPRHRRTPSTVLSPPRNPSAGGSTGIPLPRRRPSTKDASSNNHSNPGGPSDGTRNNPRSRPTSFNILRATDIAPQIQSPTSSNTGPGSSTARSRVGSRSEALHRLEGTAAPRTADGPPPPPPPRRYRPRNPFANTTAPPAPGAPRLTLTPSQRAEVVNAIDVAAGLILQQKPGLAEMRRQMEQMQAGLRGNGGVKERAEVDALRVRIEKVEGEVREAEAHVATMRRLV